MDAAEKVREARLRRMAKRQGLLLVKSRRRDPLAVDYGRYVIEDPESKRAVAGELGSSHAMTMAEVEDWLTSPDDWTVEVINEDGSRIVRRSRTATDGSVMVIQHAFPDAVRHHYRPAGMDEDVLLYLGEISYPDDERAFQGDVRFRWRPSPHIEVRGERTTTPADLSALSDLMSGVGRQGMWVAPAAVLVQIRGGVLPA